MSKVLVTGGLGFIGTHLVRALVEDGHEVAVLDNFSRLSDQGLPAETEVHHRDIRDPEGLEDVARGMDAVFHLAANANGTLSVMDPRMDFETNAVGTFNVAEAALKAGVERFVYVSSAAVYGTPQDFPMGEDHPKEPILPYGHSKYAGEQAALAFYHSASLPVVIGRPFCVYGPGENASYALVEVSRYLRWHLNHEPIRIVGDARRKTRDFVHVHDLVSGLMLISQRGETGAAYNVGSGVEVSMLGLVEAIERATGRPALVDVNTNVVEDTYRLVADISKIKALGYTPVYDIERGVRELAATLGERPEMPSGETIFKVGQRGESESV